MDIFAHMAWTNVVFYKKLKQERLQRFLAIFFGVLPDFVSFVPVFIYGIFGGGGFMELVGSNIWVVKYASESYKYTHSIVIFLAAVLVVFIVRKLMHKSALWWPMFGWAVHIFIDIFTHKGFYETPFLFPISPYNFSHGISWAHPTFMIINYLALTLVYFLWFLVFRKKKVL